MIKSHRPIAGWDLNFDATSGAQLATLEVSVDGGAWYEVAHDDSTQDLPLPAHTVQFRVSMPVNSPDKDLLPLNFFAFAILDMLLGSQLG